MVNCRSSPTKLMPLFHQASTYLILVSQLGCHLLQEVLLNPPGVRVKWTPYMACFRDSSALFLLHPALGVSGAVASSSQPRQLSSPRLTWRPSGLPLCASWSSPMGTLVLTPFLAGVTGPTCVKSIPGRQTRVRVSAPIFGEFLHVL